MEDFTLLLSVLVGGNGDEPQGKLMLPSLFIDTYW